MSHEVHDEDCPYQPTTAPSAAPTGALCNRTIQSDNTWSFALIV